MKEDFEKKVKKENQLVTKGIEVGHIFYFGDKYSKPLKCSVDLQDGKKVDVKMGSYGIGVSRLVGAIIEAKFNNNIMKWPESVSPFSVALIPTLQKNDKSNYLKAEKIYNLLIKNKIEKKLKVVVACGNGTAGIFAPKVLNKIGCEVVELDCNLDYNFPKYNPNPEDIKMLQAISEAVKKNKADIGFGFDGDGDRVGIVDNNGNEIYSDKVGLLIARNLAPNYNNKKFIVDVKSTGLFTKDKVLLENNCETIYWKTGHSHIKRKVNEVKALAGFEKSGHFFFNQPLGNGYDDGINSAIQVCHLLDNKNKKISEIINELPKTYQTPTMAPFCKDEEKYQVVESLVKEVQNLKTNNTKIDDQKIADILTVNGVRFSLEDGSWGLIRASSNKPSLVVVTESPTSDKRKKKIFEFIDKLLKETGKVGKYDQKI